MKWIAVVLAVVIIAGAALAWALSAPRPRYSAEEWQALGLSGDAAAGRLVFYAGGCESCHKSPGQDDPLRLGGGLELKTPFGSFYPPNISTDPVDGIGAWRPVDVANALLSGVSPNGGHLYPAFPYTSYQRMNPKDVADLAAFLRTVPAVKGKAPANALPFPFSIRRAVGLWKLLYFDNAGLRPDPSQSEQWNRGRYLVEGPGHCGECHTPRGFLGEMDAKPRARRRAIARRSWQGGKPERRRLSELDRRRHCRGSDQRLHAWRRRSWRGHDRRCAQPGRIARVRPSGDRRLSQEPAAARAAAPAKP